MSGEKKVRFAETNSSVTVREYNTRKVQRKDKFLGKTRKVKVVSSSKRKNSRGKENVRPVRTKRLCRRVPKKLDTSEAVSTTTVETPEEQIEKVKKILQKPLSKILLTSEELQKLSMKYKIDGHYRINLNLPPFDTLLDNANSEDLEVSSTVPRNPEYQPQMSNTGRYEETELTSDIDYKKCCIKGNEIDYHNYQNVFPCSELKDFNNVNTLILNEVSNRNREYNTYGLATAENSMRHMDQHNDFEYISTNISPIMTNTNVLCNDIPSNVMQQYNIPHHMYYQNLSELNNGNTFREQQSTDQNVALINPVIYNENSYCPNRFTNDSFLINQNSTAPLYPPLETGTATYFNNMHNRNNSTIMCQSTNIALIQNYTEKENQYDSNYAASIYPLTSDSRNLTCDYSTNNTDLHHFNNYPYENNVCAQNSTTVMSDAMSFILEADACAMSLVNTNEMNIPN